jgi:hypothetical protein
MTFFLALFASTSLVAGQPRIIKVLPHLVDWKGHHTVAPSLYERDAYQLHLKETPNAVGGLRFDIQWKATRQQSDNLELRIEARGSKSSLEKPKVFSAKVEKRRHFSKWSSIRLEKQDYTELGQLIAWRATLWDGDKMIAEQQSFLW